MEHQGKGELKPNNNSLSPQIMVSDHKGTQIKPQQMHLNDSGLKPPVSMSGNHHLNDSGLKPASSMLGTQHLHGTTNKLNSTVSQSLAGSRFSMSGMSLSGMASMDAFTLKQKFNLNVEAPTEEFRKFRLAMKHPAEVLNIDLSGISIKHVLNY